MFRRAPVLAVLFGFGVLALPGLARAQNTYHLHNEASTTANLKQVKTANPDVALVALLSANLKGTANGEKLIKEFDTPTGVPNLAGTMQTGTTLVFQVVMRKTANVAAMVPRVKVFLNNASGTQVCVQNGGTALSTTLTKYTINCTTTANVTLVAGSRYYVWVGVNQTAMNSTTNYMAELDIEGTLNGALSDSQVSIPDPPSVTSIVPGSAGIGQGVTVNGVNFGATGTLKFNSNKTATPTSWTSTAIQAPVPTGAITGNVTVTVGTRVSTGVSFTVLPTPTITSLSTTVGAVGTAVGVNGTNFGNPQGGSTIKFNGVNASVSSWTSGHIDTTVPTGATTGPIVVTVNGVPSAGTSFTVSPKLNTLTPSTAHLSDPITIAGTSFLATQGSSTVTFSGTPASPTTWSDTSITVPVPAAATSGNVVVTVAGQASNALPFTLIPPPTLATVTPGTGHIGNAVTVTGTNFGATQGTNTIRFNGTAAAPTSWSDTSISAPVPAGATTGNVVVTVSNQPSNGLPFTVILPGTISGTITRVTGGTGISGASVQALQLGVIKGSATTSGTGAYAIAALDPGTYEVRIAATGFSSELRQGQVVANGGTTTLNVAMSAPGSVTGKVTQADGVTPLVGAAVAVYSGPQQKGAASTNATGDYTVAGLHPGALTVQAAYAGYTTGEQGATVVESAATTKNFALNGAPANPVRYAYDELNRLIQVTDPAGQSAIYRYDAVGNITAIERPGASAVAISGFAPTSGATGTSVTIFGTGFSTTSSNTVTFGAGQVLATAASLTQLVVTVPAAATTSTIGLSNTSGSATSSGTYTVTAGSAAPTISGFSPGIAAVDTTLTINGTNFDTVPANDRVNLNLTFAAVSTATATSLSATIPLTATSGPVNVATQNGVATTATDLFVAPAPHPASDVDIAQRIAIGDTRSVTINDAGHVALYTFAGTQGQHVALAGTGTTAQVFGCDVTAAILLPSGGTLGVAPEACMEQSGIIDNSILPSTGIYTVYVVPISPAVGNVLTFTLYDVTAEATAPITAGGSPVTITTTKPGQNARLTFSGTAGQRVSVVGTNGLSGQIAFICDVTVSLVTASGVEVGFPTCMEQNGFLDVVTLPATGNYAVFVDPQGAAVGSLTATLYNVPADASGSIAINGSAVTLTTTTPGQNGTLTFSATSGQRISLAGTNGMSGQVFLACDVNVSIRKPDGTDLAAPVCMEGSGFIEPLTVPATGTYTIFMDPQGPSIGSLTLALYIVSDVTGTIAIGGAAQTVTITTPGQNGLLTFSGTSGQRISLAGTNVSGFNVNFGCDLNVTIVNPDTTTLTSACMDAGGFIDATSLPATGTYTILVDPAGGTTGAITLTLYGVSDTSGTITIGGAAQTVTIATPGQNGTLTFSGTIGQRVSLTGTNVSGFNVSFGCDLNVSILKPDTSVLVGATCMDAGGFIDATDLPATGTYTISIDPAGSATGSITLTLYSVTDATGSITIGGAAGPVTIGTPGQNGALTFSGTASQSISVQGTNVSGFNVSFGCDLNVTVKKPDGSTLAGPACMDAGGSIGSTTLPTTGTYTVFIDPRGSVTGSITVTVSSP